MIPNWADGEQIRPIPHERNPLRTEWGLQEKFVVEYSGNLGRAHDAETLLGAAHKLAHRDDIRFLFIGGGVYLAWFQERARALGLTNVLFKEYQPRERLDESLGVGDVHLVSLRPEMEGLVFPSKLYGIFAAAQPVIHVGDTNGEVARFLSARGCGWSVPSGDADALRARIEYLAGDAAPRVAASSAAHEVFRDGLDRPHALEHWRGLLQGTP